MGSVRGSKGVGFTQCLDSHGVLLKTLRLIRNGLFDYELQQRPRAYSVLEKRTGEYFSQLIEDGFGRNRRLLH